MINTNDFEEMKKEMEDFEQHRDYLIGKNREIIRMSKKIIYSVHRNDMKEAEESVKKIKELVRKTDKDISKVPVLLYSGVLKNAIQEYVEAVCFFEVIKNRKLPTHKELNAQAEHYLLGICDLIGEISRISINSAAKGKEDFASEMKELVLGLYYELMKFDFSNSELRKKFDGIKYEVKRLEDMALSIKLKRG